jgi:hypothetical protein
MAQTQKQELLEELERALVEIGKIGGTAEIADEATDAERRVEMLLAISKASRTLTQAVSDVLFFLVHLDENGDGVKTTD